MSSTSGSKDRRYRDENWLREQYLDNGLSSYEMAGICGVDPGTIRNWCRKKDIELRPPNQEKPPNYGHHGQGYPMWTTWCDDERQHVYVHRLAAVAWFGWDAVIDNDVHHRNGIPWDNRESNIELMSHADHARHHTEMDLESTDKRYRDCEWLSEQYSEKQLSMATIGEMCDVSDETIRRWLVKCKIETRSKMGGHTQ